MEEIKVPLAFRASVLHPAQTSPSISEPVQAGQKRKSDVSYSVGGANLRQKTSRIPIKHRQLIVDNLLSKGGCWNINVFFPLYKQCNLRTAMDQFFTQKANKLNTHSNKQLVEERTELP